MKYRLSKNKHLSQAIKKKYHHRKKQNQKLYGNKRYLEKTMTRIYKNRINEAYINHDINSIITDEQMVADYHYISLPVNETNQGGDSYLLTNSQPKLSMLYEKAVENKLLSEYIIV